MPQFDVGAVLKSMAAAAEGVLQSKWPEVKSFATTEFQKIAQTIVSIGEGVAAGCVGGATPASVSALSRTARSSLMGTAPSIC